VVDELALGLELPARVLVDEDVPLSREVVVRAEHGPILLGPVRADAVRRARHEHRVAHAGVSGSVDDREQLHAVAHRDEQLALGVVRFHVVRGLRRRNRHEQRPGDGQAGQRLGRAEYGFHLGLLRKRPPTIIRAT
jgi:hypothetical protein